MPDDQRRPRGILDTSVVIDFEDIDASELPIEVAMSAITLAELAAGPAATALAAGLPLYTRNGNDFRVLEGLVDVVVV